LVSSKPSARADAKGASCGDFFVGVSLAFILYSFYEEWQQGRLNKKRLSDMRKNFKVGRPFDVAKGEWGND
jgi:hypothetical protein